MTTPQTAKAYAVDFFLYSLLGQIYYLSAEPEADKGREPTKDELGSDCSGAQEEALAQGGGVDLRALLGTTRPTAETFQSHSTPLPTGMKPYPGCYAFHPRNAFGAGVKATHIIKAVAPYPFTIESGDGTGHVARHTIDWQTARGCAWGPINGLSFDPVKAAADHAWRNPWPVMGLGYEGYHARLLKSILNQTQAAGLTITDADPGEHIGPATALQINRARVNHGLSIAGKSNGLCDDALVLVLHTSLGL